MRITNIDARMGIAMNTCEVQLYDPSTQKEHFVSAAICDGEYTLCETSISIFDPESSLIRGYALDETLEGPFKDAFALAIHLVNLIS